MAKYCTNCGTAVEQSWNICPNCGQTIRFQTQSLETQQPDSVPTQTPAIVKISPSGGSNTFGYFAIGFGVIGLFIFGIIFGIIAIILGAIGSNQDENTSMASIGLILGVLDIVCCFILYFIILGSFTFWYW